MSFAMQQRYVLTCMIFCAILVGIAERSVLSMAITQMVNRPHQNNSAKPAAETYCSPPFWTVNQTESTATVDLVKTGEKYNWTQKEQGMILSSFYVGYIVTQIPGGLLAQRFGGKYVLGLGITISAALSMLIPLAVQHGGVNALIAIRILMGAFQGPMYPSVAHLLSAWVPTIERAFLASVALSGLAVGTVLASYFSGLILHFYSWESTFYIFGSVAIIWFICFVMLCHSNPVSHPIISAGEKEYLMRELGQLEQNKHKRPTPWRDILTSKPVWALILSYFFADFAYYVVATTLPKYMNDVLQLSIHDIGIFTSLPWIAKAFVSYVVGFVTDRCIVSGKISVTAARKVAVCLGSVFPAIFTILASYAGCNHILIVVFFIASIGMRGCLSVSTHLTPMDLSPNYAGALMSLANGAGALNGILAPYMVGLLTPNALLSEWRLVFWISFVFYMIENVVFCVWGSGEVQPWNIEQPKPVSSEYNMILNPKLKRRRPITIIRKEKTANKLETLEINS